jgi:serine/threonine-protein kinase RsbW
MKWVQPAHPCFVPIPAFAPCPGSSRVAFPRAVHSREAAAALTSGCIDLDSSAVIRIHVLAAEDFPRTRMAPNTQRIEVTLETLLESVDLAESITMRIAEAAGFPDEEIHKIGMAVREGVINAYNYGNQQDRQKKILMTVELAPENMTVKVIDQGQGFELTEIPDPLAEENLLRTSGRGLFLMRAFMDEFKVERGPEGGAQLVMIKKLPHVLSDNHKHQPE